MNEFPYFCPKCGQGCSMFRKRSDFPTVMCEDCYYEMAGHDKPEFTEEVIPELD